MKAYFERLSSEGVGVLLLLLSIVLATLEAVVVRLMADRLSMGQLLPQPQAVATSSTMPAVLTR